MKKYAFILVGILLVGCDNTNQAEWKSNTVNLTVPGLEDCTLTVIGRPGLSAPDRVYRCPNSQTTNTYNCGKGCQQNITTIDEPAKQEEVEYVEDCTEEEVVE